MTIPYDLSRGLRQGVIPLLCVAIIGYIAYHAVQGDRGLAAWRQLTQQIQSVEANLSEAKRTRFELEHRVSLLRSNGLDRDMLDERARIVLGLAHPDELIFLK